MRANEKQGGGVSVCFRRWEKPKILLRVERAASGEEGAESGAVLVFTGSTAILLEFVKPLTRITLLKTVI